MADYLLLTDADDPAVRGATGLLESWGLELVDAAALPNAVGNAGIRAVLITTSDPSLLRAGVEHAHAVGLPVIVGCADDAARRRAVELRAEEWYRMPAEAEEIAARVRAAAARGRTGATELEDRVERVEYEQMLHDALTGLPTLPVMIENSRALFKERGELVVLYLNFVRYSKIEEIYGWEK